MKRPSLLPYAFTSLLYMLLGLEVRTRVASPDWPFFMQVLNQTLHGDPFTIYSARVFEFHSFAWGPMSLYAMAPFKLLSEALGAPEPLERWLVWLPIYFADVISGLLIVRIARRGPLAAAGGMLPFVYAFYLLSWLVFFASPVHSHFESLLLVFVLLSLLSTERRLYILGGVLSGAALLTKQSAIVVVLPQLLILWRAAGAGAAARYAGAAAATGLLVMAPYMAADFANVWYMAVTLPGRLPVAFQSILPIWKSLPGLHSFLVEYGNAIILLLVLSVSLLAVLLRRIVPGGPHAYALFSLAALIMLDLEKWGLPHFFVLPFALLLLWELLAGRWPLAALLLAAGTTAMYVINADAATGLSFSYLLAPLALLLLGLTAYVSAWLFRPPLRHQPAD